MYFIKILRAVKLNKLYILYALAYGLSSLVIPLAAQFLVNNLALAGIWINTISFLLIIGTIFSVGQILNHTQLVLVEYLQRHIYIKEIDKWKSISEDIPTQYYFENYSLLKSFSKIYTNFIDTGLVAVFGFSAIIVFHPVFLILPIVTGVTLYFIKRLFTPALRTSILESDCKYKMYEELSSKKQITKEQINSYLEARDDHFAYTRIISVKISMLHVFGHLYVLAAGCYLVQINQLSIGQLVAAEIIISGVMQSLLKLPHAIESLYDFETSHYKIVKALGGLRENDH